MHALRFGAMGGLALAASLVFVVALNFHVTHFEDEIVAHHRHALAVQLTAISTSDEGALRRWLNGKLNVVPPIVSSTEAGFRLSGARIDPIEGRTAAAIVYEHGGKIIDLYFWPSPEEPVGQTSSQGYNLVHWTKGGLKYCAVSSLSLSELEIFRDDLTREGAL